MDENVEISVSAEMSVRVSNGNDVVAGNGLQA